jgi:hypothetical protein
MYSKSDPLKYLAVDDSELTRLGPLHVENDSLSDVGRRRGRCGMADPGVSF